MNLGLSLSPADCMHQCLSQKQPPPPEVLLLMPFLLGVLAVNTRLLLEQCRAAQQQIATNTFHAGLSWRLEGGCCFILGALISWHSTSLDWPEGSLLSSQGALSPLHHIISGKMYSCFLATEWQKTERAESPAPSPTQRLDPANPWHLCFS